MQRRTIAVSLALTLLLIASVYASWGCSVIYNKFNSIDWSDYELDKTYTAVTIDVYNYLTYNETTANDQAVAKVAFTNDTSANPLGINLLFYKDGTLKVFYIDGPTEVQIGSGTWSKGNATRVVLANGEVTVYAKYGVKDQQATVVNGFSFSEEFAYLRVKGETAYVAEDGYVQVEVNPGTANVSYAVQAWIPTLVSLAMLGMAIGMIKKYT